MRSNEKYCADRLRIRESEQFFAVGDTRLGKFLQCEPSQSLPDLLSFTNAGSGMRFRIREVKFKLEDRLVIKAIGQLRAGVEWLNRKFDSPPVDRVELVIPVKQRPLKPAERYFLGPELEPGRFELRLNDKAQTLIVNGTTHPITVLLI